MTDERMTSPDLPAELKAALDGKLRGFSRSDAAGRAASISKTYRDGGGSGGIRSEDRCAGLCAGADARDLCRGHGQPERAASRSGRTSRPTSLLDIGAGPGTATWAAAEAFPSLQRFALLDANDALRTLALDLVTRQLSPA